MSTHSRPGPALSTGSVTAATQAPKAAQAAYERALTAHWDAEGRYELAVLRSDHEGRESARQALHAATARLAEARAAVVAAQATAASFEDLLRNPYLQFDRDGVVLASIRPAPTAAGWTRLPSPAAVEPGWTGLPNLAGMLPRPARSGACLAAGMTRPARRPRP